MVSDRTLEEISLHFYFYIGHLVPDLKLVYIALDPLTTKERH